MVGMLNKDRFQVGSPSMINVDYFEEYVRNIYDNHWFTNNGPMVRNLEFDMKKRLGVKYCIAVVNATMGLQILAKALRVKKVIMPAFTFVATAHAFKWIGCAVELVDVDDTHHIDINKLDERLRWSNKFWGDTRPDTIVGVHIWGEPCYINDIKEVADRYGVKNIIYDAAHAFDVEYHGVKHIGNFGDAEVFSFHATKFINGFEGGMITTNNEKIANKCKALRNFGFADASGEHTLGVGTNAKMTEICAAAVLANMTNINTLKNINENIYNQYRLELRDTFVARVYEFGHTNSKYNYQYVPIQIMRPFSRDKIMELLNSIGVKARRYFYPGIHMIKPYSRMHKHMPITDEICESILCLPTGPQMLEDGIVADICRIIKGV